MTTQESDEVMMMTIVQNWYEEVRSGKCSDSQPASPGLSPEHKQVNAVDELTQLINADLTGSLSVDQPGNIFDDHEPFKLPPSIIETNPWNKIDWNFYAETHNEASGDYILIIDKLVCGTYWKPEAELRIRGVSGATPEQENKIYQLPLNLSPTQLNFQIHLKLVKPDIFFMDRQTATSLVKIPEVEVRESSFNVCAISWDPQFKIPPGLFSSVVDMSVEFVGKFESLQLDDNGNSGHGKYLLKKTTQGFQQEAGCYVSLYLTDGTLIGMLLVAGQRRCSPYPLDRHTYRVFAGAMHKTHCKELGVANIDVASMLWSHFLNETFMTNNGLITLVVSDGPALNDDLWRAFLGRKRDVPHIEHPGGDDKLFLAIAKDYFNGEPQRGDYRVNMWRPRGICFPGL